MKIIYFRKLDICSYCLLYASFTHHEAYVCIVYLLTHCTSELCLVVWFLKIKHAVLATRTFFSNCLTFIFWRTRHMIWSLTKPNALFTIKIEFCQVYWPPWVWYFNQNHFKFECHLNRKKTINSSFLLFYLLLADCISHGIV